MVDVSFAAFTAKSFEQFAQALSEHVLGRGILIYGAGPDGGREAATTATLTYPTPVDGWRRYTVVQAKFLERSSTPAKDADWLVSQIRMEALHWKQRREKPANLLFISNVRLSGVEGRGRKGGQQKVEEAFQEHLQPLGVEHMHVWHEEKIGTLLDGFPDLYRSYLGWLSPRDLLATVFESFSASVPHFDRTMIRFLQHELRDQRSVNLLQAGHAADDQVPLESVFVYLPVQTEDRAGASNVENGEVLRTLMGAAALKLDPASLAMS
jgi:hypothetical protein